MLETNFSNNILRQTILLLHYEEKFANIGKLKSLKTLPNKDGAFQVGKYSQLTQNPNFLEMRPAADLNQEKTDLEVSKYTHYS